MKKDIVVRGVDLNGAIGIIETPHGDYLSLYHTEPTIRKLDGEDIGETYFAVTLGRAPAQHDQFRSRNFELMFRSEEFFRQGDYNDGRYYAFTSSGIKPEDILLQYWRAMTLLGEAEELQGDCVSGTAMHCAGWANRPENIKNNWLKEQIPEETFMRILNGEPDDLEQKITIARLIIGITDHSRGARVDEKYFGTLKYIK